MTDEQKPGAYSSIKLKHLCAYDSYSWQLKQIAVTVLNSKQQITHARMNTWIQ